ncbi:MAG: DUF2817 domain-containing protein [Hahellaceae bacterium]|nr:DUF2817 domain-containing protein [Hahellaceae bacterium]
MAVSSIPIQELNKLERLLQQGAPYIRHRVLTRVRFRGHNLPIDALQVGDALPDKPALLLTGGIHGLERIGTQVILAFLETLIKRLVWDTHLQAELNDVQLFMIPALNPSGMIRNTRSNGNGIDLMRHAPLDAADPVPLLLGGHRLTTRLPWYRGALDAPMEPEAEALCVFVREHLFKAPFSLVLDCHSGFGFNDRIWFPFAGRSTPIQHLPEVYALRNLLFETYPNHVYLFEPQFANYGTHGDLWDYLYLESLNQASPFLPLTLEMGSWAWARKNPLQLTRLMGFFHPILPHRLKRVLRRHLILLDFLVAAVRSQAQWCPSLQDRAHYDLTARALWYP